MQVRYCFLGILNRSKLQLVRAMNLRHIIGDLNEYGLITYGAYGLDRILRRCHPALGIEYFYLFALSLQKFEDQLRVPASVLKAYQIEILTSPSAALSAFGTSRKTIDFRFSQDVTCLLIKNRGAPAGFLWLARKIFHEDIAFSDYILPACAMWDFDVVILPRYRLTPAFIALWKHAQLWMHAQGVRWVFSRIAVTNKNSLTVHQKLGGNPIGRLIFLKFGAIQFCLDGLTFKFSKHSAARRKKVVLPDLG